MRICVDLCKSVKIRAGKIWPFPFSFLLLFYLFVMTSTFGVRHSIFNISFLTKSSMRLFLAAAILLSPVLLTGCMGRLMAREELTGAFWRIEDARMRAQYRFADNYYASENDRRAAAIELRTDQAAIDAAGETLEKMQDKYRLQSDDAFEQLHDMQSTASSLVELYVYEIAPRSRPRFGEISAAEERILGVYLPARNKAARLLGVPDARRRRIILRRIAPN